MPNTAGPEQATERVDARIPRFTASVTLAVLISALIVSTFSPRGAAVVLALQAVVFLIGAVGGPLRHPYGALFSRVLAPRLGPGSATEDVPLLRFSQGMGVVFAVVGAIGFGSGLTSLGVIATGLACFAAFMRSVFGICLSRRLFALVQRLRGHRLAAHQE